MVIHSICIFIEWNEGIQKDTEEDVEKHCCALNIN